MEQYAFSKELSERVVRGIIKGYKSYVEERSKKKRELLISSAYAWVIGNHIDHYVAEETKSLGVRFHFSKAGYSWGYIQFLDVRNNSLFLIKNADGIPKKQNQRPRRPDGYIEMMARRINGNIDFSGSSVVHEQMNLFPVYEQTELNLEPLDHVLEQMEEIEQFYIVTYTINEEKRISNISLCLPHPETYELHVVDDWSEIIDNVGIKISDKALSKLEDDQNHKKQISFDM
mgnify:CR=1 FL=1